MPVIVRKKYNPKTTKLVRYTRKGQSYARRRRNRVPRTMVNRAKSTFVSPCFLTKHTFYYKINTATATVDVPINSQFELNHLEAPVAGNQPYGFDQISALYKRYRVLGVSYDITLRSQGGATEGAVVSLFFSPSTTVPVTVKQMIEDRKTRFRHLGGLTSSKTITRFKGYRSIASVEGISPRVVATDLDYSAEVGAGGPEETAYLNVLFASTDVNVVDYMGIVKLTFYTKWTDPITVASS